MDGYICNGPEERTRCLIKFQFSYPQDLWAQSKKRGTSGRVDGFTEDGRLIDQIWMGISIWNNRVLTLCAMGLMHGIIEDHSCNLSQA